MLKSFLYTTYFILYTIIRKKCNYFSNINKKVNDFNTQQKPSGISTRELPDSQISVYEINAEVIFILWGLNGEYKLRGLFRDGVKFTSKCVNFTSKMPKFTSKRGFHAFHVHCHSFFQGNCQVRKSQFDSAKHNQGD
jgi:hypothetical protein